MPALVLLSQLVLRMLAVMLLVPCKFEVPLMVEPKKLTRLVLGQQKWNPLLARAQELRTARAVEQPARSKLPPVLAVPSTWLMLRSSLGLARCTLPLALALAQVLGTAQAVAQKAQGKPLVQLAQHMQRMLCSSPVVARCTLQLLLASEQPLALVLVRMLRTTPRVVPSTWRMLRSSLAVVDLRMLVLHTWLPAGEQGSCKMHTREQQRPGEPPPTRAQQQRTAERLRTSVHQRPAEPPHTS
jgi:hypothetical protein